MRISKSKFNAKTLEVLRSVEMTGQSVLITERGIPTVEIRPYQGKLRDAKEMLRGSVLAFDYPYEKTGEQWDSLL